MKNLMQEEELLRNIDFAATDFRTYLSLKTFYKRQFTQLFILNPSKIFTCLSVERSQALCSI